MSPGTGAGPAIHAVAVTKTYGHGAGRVDALRGVDLVVAPGEFVALTGPSGSGKSTLLHLLAGLDAPTGGTLRVGGTDLAGLGEEGRAAFRRTTLGLVVQSFDLLDILSAEENVALPLSLHGATAAAASRRARDLLDRVGLGGRRDHRPAQLSGGEQQRVAVARALAADPPVLLADEPTGNLDTANGRRVFGLLRELAGERRRTIVLVTHDPALAAETDRVVPLRDGLVVGGGPG